MTPTGEKADAGQTAATHASSRFTTTHWSVVLRAGATHDGHQALEQLCRTYWYPLYAFARKHGASPTEAPDLTQGFFEMLLEEHLVRKADPRAGKFRSFLLASFKHFIANQEARARAQKRGGGRKLFTIDGTVGELMFGREPAGPEAAERLFERIWVNKVLEQALDRLSGEFREAGRAEVFEYLSPMLEGDRVEGGYASAARKLGVVEGTIKWTVSRMRARYRSLIRSVIAETVSTPVELEEEMQHLVSVLRN
jgi:RNA polymerase sigma factor (sigma-70 family)